MSNYRFKSENSSCTGDTKIAVTCSVEFVEEHCYKESGAFSKYSKKPSNIQPEKLSSVPSRDEIRDNSERCHSRN